MALVRGLGMTIGRMSLVMIASTRYTHLEFGSWNCVHVWWGLATHAPRGWSRRSLASKCCRWQRHISQALQVGFPCVGHCNLLCHVCNGFPCLIFGSIYDPYADNISDRCMTLKYILQLLSVAGVLSGRCWVIKYFMRYWSFSCGCVEGIGKG